MHWLNGIVDRLIANHPDGEIVVSSGVSPSGTYHLGTLREVLTAEVIARELRRRGRQARHIHVVDDLDAFRKVPANIDSSYEKYLGMPLCDVPSPDGTEGKSYADFFLQDLLEAIKAMGLDVDVIRSHQRYREGFFVPAIEKTLQNIVEIRTILEEVSGRKLDPKWTPIQILENGRVKNRQFDAIDEEAKTLSYESADGSKVSASYANGDVTLSWRVDWPARWWLLDVAAEPFGRDHATKGGSYDTGVEIAKKVFGVEAPLPVPYNFINRIGDTKKMSKSSGNVVTAKQLLEVMPSELVWFFILRYAPEKQLFFGEGETLLRLFDEFAALLVKENKEPWEEQLLDLCLYGVKKQTISNVPFSHLVASYQAALRDEDKTVEIIQRTEHADVAGEQAEIIKRELKLIDSWLGNWAPEELKFSLIGKPEIPEFNKHEIEYFDKLAEKITQAPEDADGAWFHEMIYSLKEEANLPPKELFSSLYRLIIGKASGPRAGWFLSLLDREWLVKRLKREG